VDLFFVLSGFVIAYSYEDRLRRVMTWRRFMALRLIRLYPLYVVGLVLGTMALLGREAQLPERGIDWGLFAQAFVSAALMLPNWGTPAIVGPRWSLTYELVANAVYAAVIRRLSSAVLLVIAAVSGAALVALVRATGTVDAGWDADQAPVALARVSFSFFAGVLLFRIYDRQAGRLWLAMATAVAALLTTAAWLLIPWMQQRAELGLIFLVFPAVTLLCAYPDVRGRWASLCGLLGATSYALYVVHQPASLLYEAVLRRVLPGYEALAPFAGWSLAVLLVGGCWWLDRYYDRPVRRWLAARLDR